MNVQSVSRNPLVSEPSALQQSQDRTYVVQRGDTLSAIAADHNVSLTALHAANPQVLNPDVLYPDQMLEIPVGDQAPHALAGGHAQSLPAETAVHADAPASTLQLLAAKAPATLVPSNAPTPTLREGAHGAAVRTLQEGLRKGGFNPGPVDGIFGPKTEAAVKAFQAKHGLQVDGIVGPKTWAALKSAHVPTKPPVTPPDNPPSTRGAKIADAAKQLANHGYHYTWGGGHRSKPGASTGSYDNPNTKVNDRSVKGLDCSGFARLAIYKATGKDIGGITAQQIYDRKVTHISRSELKPGDLIFWKSSRGISHVAIYAGKKNGVDMMYESAPSYEKRGISNYGTHYVPMSRQDGIGPRYYGRLK